MTMPDQPASRMETMTKSDVIDGLTRQITDAFMREVSASWPAIRAAQQIGDLAQAEELARNALESATPMAIAIFERRIAEINGDKLS